MFLLPALTKPHFASQFGTLPRVIGSNHRVVRGKPPFLAVSLGRHIVSCSQMTLQRFELLAILKTHDVLVRH